MKTYKRYLLQGNKGLNQRTFLTHRLPGQYQLANTPCSISKLCLVIQYNPTPFLTLLTNKRFVRKKKKKNLEKVILLLHGMKLRITSALNTLNLKRHSLLLFLQDAQNLRTCVCTKTKTQRLESLDQLSLSSKKHRTWQI